MKKLFILWKLIFIPFMAFCQPNKSKVDSVLLSHDTLYQWINGVRSVRGVVSQTNGSSASTINYLSNGNYISQTSGQASTQYGFWNTAIGDNALDSSRSDFTSYNICIGKDAGRSINGAQDNVFMGWDAGYHTKGGSANIGIVEDALFSNEGGRDNIALGRGAIYSHKNGSSNIGIGYNTLYYTTAGTENTAVGSYALGFMQGGYGVTAVGAYAGEMNGAGAGKTIYNSTYIGYSAGLNSMFSNVILIGANTEATADNQINIGNKIFYRNNSFEIAGSNVTIGGYTYHVTNTPPVGTQSTLVADGLGNVTWTPIQQPTTKAVQPPPQSGTYIAFNELGQKFFLVRITQR